MHICSSSCENTTKEKDIHTVKMSSRSSFTCIQYLLISLINIIKRIVQDCIITVKWSKHPQTYRECVISPIIVTDETLFLVLSD